MGIQSVAGDTSASHGTISHDSGIVLNERGILEGNDDRTCQ